MHGFGRIVSRLVCSTDLAPKGRDPLIFLGFFGLGASPGLTEKSEKIGFFGFFGLRAPPELLRWAKVGDWLYYYYYYYYYSASARPHKRNVIFFLLLKNEKSKKLSQQSTLTALLELI